MIIEERCGSVLLAYLETLLLTVLAVASSMVLVLYFYEHGLPR